jgi:hypothetical protein
VRSPSGGGDKARASSFAAFFRALFILAHFIGFGKVFFKNFCPAAIFLPTKAKPLPIRRKNRAIAVKIAVQTSKTASDASRKYNSAPAPAESAI